MDPDDLERALPDRFGRLLTRFAARQPDECDGPSVARPFARGQQRVLTNSTKTGRQPVANVTKPLVHARLVRNSAVPAGFRARYRPSGENASPDLAATEHTPLSAVHFSCRRRERRTLKSNGNHGS